MMGGGVNTVSIQVFFDPDADLEQEAAELRHSLQGIAEEGAVTVTTGQVLAAQTMDSGLDISVRAKNYEDIALLSSQLLSELESIDGIADLEINIASVEPKLDIKLDPSKLQTSGLPLEQLQQINQEFFLLGLGGTVAQANIEGRIYEVFLEGIAQDLGSVEVARELRIGYPESVALGDIAAVELNQRPISIMRIDEKLAASITGSITEENVGAVNRAVQEKVDTLPLVPGAEVTIGGMAEMMGESFSGMFIAIIVAVVLAYVVLVVTFRSFLNPFIIMISLPLASIGALLGLLIAGQPLGASALMGILMLVGIVLTNAIVLIASVEQLHKRGLSTYDALVEGGRTRLRPILMTAITTMIAMLPLALGLGAGTVMSAELAVVVIGGLFTSTLLTLLVIPVIYSLFRGLRQTSAG
jgi:HAE1 family hydrophobic/amphiphilic exporter-1